ncbi:MAG TPA: hypothetical protein VL068_00120, partial [Microthrixaceae bacterium]|nr:hypothetical protein [Microthrixaceae bacterium]
DSDPDAETGQVWAEWLPGADQADKVDQLLDALEGAEDPYQRLAVTALLSEADFDSRRRAEAIIDGPVAAYALMALDTELGGEPDEEDDRLNVLDPGPGVDDLPAVLSDGRSARQALAELPRSLSMLPILDMLWIQMMDDPDDLFATTVEFDTSGGTTFIEILDDLWRVDMPEAAELLEFLGREHPEKKVSKAARKALFRFRNAKV